MNDYENKKIEEIVEDLEYQITHFDMHPDTRKELFRKALEDAKQEGIIEIWDYVE